MRFKRIMLFLVLSLLVCETNLSYGDYRDLINIGSKFKVLIESLGESEAKIGLTKNRLRTITELRLRREGIILISEASREIPCFYVNVLVVGQAYHVSLEIHEWVELKRIPVDHGTIAIIWSKTVTGTHGGVSEWIISSLNKLLDIFLNDYYKANPKENQRGEKEEGERVEEKRDFQFSATTFLRR